MKKESLLIHLASFVFITFSTVFLSCSGPQTLTTDGKPVPSRVTTLSYPFGKPHLAGIIWSSEFSRQKWNHESRRESFKDAGVGGSISCKWDDTGSIYKWAWNCHFCFTLLVNQVLSEEQWDWFYTIGWHYSAGTPDCVPNGTEIHIPAQTSVVLIQQLEILWYHVFGILHPHFLFRAPTDMRKSFDGLCRIITDQLNQNPMSGDIFVFINKQRNRVKLLRWEPGGFVPFYKRLERVTFKLTPREQSALGNTLEYTELTIIISGVSLRNAKKTNTFLQQNAMGK